jgi:sortase A
MLDHAVGHVRGTALPGSSGNVGIAGHRDTFFRRLGRVRRGDLIRITTVDGEFAYRVVRTAIVSPRRVELLRDGPSPMLTIVTCYPFRAIGPAPDRFVVQAKQV